jgi:hypothetical protein
MAMKRLILATAIAAAAFGGASIPSAAADLGPGYGEGAEHARTVWHRSANRWSHRWNWRDRCAWAGYYCLYAWDGYVYHYPWDDRPSAHAYYSRRHHHRL